MNKYKIVDNGYEEYEVEAENALKAITKWMETYHNPYIIEFFADNSMEYLARLKITRIK